MRFLIGRCIVTMIIALSTGRLSAGVVTDVGKDLEIIGVGAALDGERLTVLAGRRASGDISGSFVEVGLIIVPAAGGKGKFTNIPELDGSTDVNFQHAFSNEGELYFEKTADTGVIRVGKVGTGRSAGASIALPPELRDSSFRVSNIAVLNNGELDIGMNSRGDGALLSMKPDLSVKSIRKIPGSTNFHGVLRLRGEAGRFMIVSSTGTDAWRGRVTITLELRAPDLVATIGRQQVMGMPSLPVQSPDGTRIALSTRSYQPGLVTTHLYDASLALVKSQVIVDQPYYFAPVGILLSDSRLVALHVDKGKCYATVADSRDGRQLARHDVTAGSGMRCLNVSGVIAGTRLMLAAAYSEENAGPASTTLMTQIVPL
ncbi:hypothetical protein [Massilia sp. CCM 8734]|uniref:hypothetical protein n=1 Tax=Massilia sp. CCM 8734 TaxID=2609283 RepID=UPI00142222BA|nr:hypothetical protein [Massilia sp. CCM 8734]NHZ97547.1 hypothetical protein [Massilia sp. CCM 8734]